MMPLFCNYHLTVYTHTSATIDLYIKHHTITSRSGNELNDVP